MTNFKEFQGKTLDDAIQEACDYYGVARERLEVEILNDAKMGIFGLVSVKKAKIRASKVQLGHVLDESEEESLATKQPATKAETKKTSKEKENGKRNKPAPSNSGKKKSSKDSPEKNVKKKPATSLDIDKDAVSFSGKNSAADLSDKKEMEAENLSDAIESQEDASGSFLTELNLESLDKDKILSLASETLKTLITPIVGDVPLQVSIEKNRIRVHVECGEDSGLLVGREGQTLASLQYIASRIISKEIGGAVRLHIDAGDYRERQDGKLSEVALFLAEKAKTTGKSQSTRLLSAYQRRIVHLALEGDETIQTTSKGEGNQRRVIIQLRKGTSKKNAKNTNEQSEQSKPVLENTPDMTESAE